MEEVLVATMSKAYVRFQRKVRGWKKEWVNRAVTFITPKYMND